MGTNIKVAGQMATRTVREHLHGLTAIATMVAGKITTTMVKVCFCIQMGTGMKAIF